MDKIVFMTFDDKGNKISLEKSMNLKEISEISNSKDDVVKIHFDIVV